VSANLQGNCGIIFNRSSRTSLYTVGEHLYLRPGVVQESGMKFSVCSLAYICILPRVAFGGVRKGFCNADGYILWIT